MLSGEDCKSHKLYIYIFYSTLRGDDFESHKLLCIPDSTLSGDDCVSSQVSFPFCSVEPIREFDSVSF